jgi:hypothetical protein
MVMDPTIMTTMALMIHTNIHISTPPTTNVKIRTWSQDT